MALANVMTAEHVNACYPQLGFTQDPVTKMWIKEEAGTSFALAPANIFVQARCGSNNFFATHPHFRNQAVIDILKNADVAFLPVMHYMYPPNSLRTSSQTQHERMNKIFRLEGKGVNPIWKPYTHHGLVVLRKDSFTYYDSFLVEGDLEKGRRYEHAARNAMTMGMNRLFQFHKSFKPFWIEIASLPSNVKNGCALLSLFLIKENSQASGAIVNGWAKEEDELKMLKDVNQWIQGEAS